MYQPQSVVRRSRRLIVFVALIVALVGSLLPAVAFAGSDYVSIEGNRRPNHGWNYNHKDSHKNDHNRHYSHSSHSSRKPKACADTHRVRKGETLSKIAKEHRVSVHALAQANGIRNVNRIYAGTTLCIPHVQHKGKSHHR